MLVLFSLSFLRPRPIYYRDVRLPSVTIFQFNCRYSFIRRLPFHYRVFHYFIYYTSDSSSRSLVVLHSTAIHYMVILYSCFSLLFYFGYRQSNFTFSNSSINSLPLRPLIFHVSYRNILQFFIFIRSPSSPYISFFVYIHLVFFISPSILYSSFASSSFFTAPSVTLVLISRDCCHQFIHHNRNY